MKSKFPLTKQPEPFTPGVTKEMVRKRLCRSLPAALREEISLEQWVLAERDLLEEVKADSSPHRVRIRPTRASCKQKAPKPVEPARARVRLQAVGKIHVNSKGGA